MRATMLVGVLLVILGLVALVYGGIGYTKKEKIVDFGPIQATATEHKTVPISPLVGGLALAGGVVLLIAGSRRGTN